MRGKNKAFVLVAHGSRLPEANQEVIDLAARLTQSLGREVIACFLEIAPPDIPHGIDLALAQNPEEIWVLPYFLTQGRHVQEDLPRILNEKARAFPETHIRLLDYLGKQAALQDLMAGILSA